MAVATPEQMKQWEADARRFWRKWLIIIGVVVVLFAAITAPWATWFGPHQDDEPAPSDRKCSITVYPHDPVTCEPTGHWENNVWVPDGD